MKVSSSFSWNVLEHIERVGGVELSGHRAFQHVVDEDLNRPMRIHALFDVLDEQTGRNRSP